MKLFILFNSNNDQVIAISDEKQYITRYILQNNFDEKYKVVTIHKEKIIEKYMIVYEELLLEEFDDVVLTAIETKIVIDTIKEEATRMECAIEDLTKMIETYSLTNKDSRILKEAIKVLKKNLKPKRISILLNIRDFIYHLFGKKSIMDYFREEYQLKEDKYYIHISVEE